MKTKEIIRNIKCKYFTYGFSNQSDLKIIDYSLGLNGTKATFKYKNNVWLRCYG